MVDLIAQRKRELREQVRNRRSLLSNEQLVASGVLLTEQLKLLVSQHKARTITCYLPVRGEPDTRGFLEWVTQQDIEVFLPIARKDGLLDWVLPSGEGTVPGAFGIDEPLGAAQGPSASSTTDLMIVPAAAADTHGNRLGWGKGYFDRDLGSMQHRPPVFAVVYEHELYEELPSEAHDVRMSGVITPERTLFF